MPPLTRTLFVDGGAASLTPDGSLNNPYVTIQAAVAAVPIPATAADSIKEWMVLIAPGDYDEDVNIEGPVRLALIGLGAFRLGRYTVAAPPQTNIVGVGGATPRNLVWTYNNAQVIQGGAAPQLVIGMIAGTDVVRHGKPIANRISGSIVIQGDAVGDAKGGTAFLAIANTQVDAGITASQTPPSPTAIDAIGFLGILVDRHFNSRFRGAILGSLSAVPGNPPAYVLATSFMSQYEGLVQVSQYASIQQAGIAAGMTVSQVPNLGTLKSVVPPGMVNSTFAGVFTGPARSLLLDAATNTWFIRNGATLAGGATKSFLAGSPIVAIHADKVLTDSDCGITLLANPTLGPLSVTLPSAAGKDDLAFTIKNVGASSAVIGPGHIVTVVSAQGETIDGKSSLTLGTPLAPGASSVIKIVAHGGRWWIVAQA